MAGMMLQEKLFIVKTQTDGQGPEQHSCDIKHLPIKLCRKGLEAWEDLFGEPNVRLVRIVLAPNLIAFLFSLADTSR